jgi:serine/threonine protein kinase
MPAPTNVADFLGYVRRSGVTDPERLGAFLAGPHDETAPAAVAEDLTREGLLTRFQAAQLLKGKWRNMILSGKYTILEPIGAGGMGSVFLCAHKIMKRCVAIKVLPASQAGDPTGLERFHREARAVAQLRHPNIVGAHDVDHDGKFHFLVMEYVDGSSLQQIVQLKGPMDLTRASHYIHQAALGLQHAHEAGLVHRDVKPANLLVDRDGTVKVLDLGLARFFYDKTDALTKKYESGAILGTADYLAPEQAVDSHQADARADIYSLGVTFYFLLAGRSPYQDGTIAQKLLWHQIREPKPIREVRPEIPEGMAAVLAKMTAKEPDHRYQSMGDVAEALTPWTGTVIPAPTEDELPRYGAAIRRAGLNDSSHLPGKPPGGSSRPPGPAKPPSSRPGWTGAKPPSSARGDDPSIVITVSDGLSDTTPSLHPPRRTGRPAPSVALPAMQPWMLWAAIAGAAVVLLSAAGVGAWACWPTSKPVAVAPGTGGPPGPPPPADGKPNPPKDPAPAGAVEITKKLGGFHVATPKYEAVVDATDGCLISVRVGGVEFLKTGAALAGGKTFARGAYFYSEKEGNEGAVKLPTIERPAPNVVEASGDKFSVRYEFTPDAVTLTAGNHTDYDAPFYLIFDSATVGEVVNGGGERLSLPLAKAQSDPVEPKWKTTTWVAGRARLAVDGGTRIWGPFSEFGSQVLDAPTTTYGTAKLVLTPSLGSEPEKPILKPGGVLLTRDGSARRVRTELYETVVEQDGCLPSLRIDGVEVLHSGVDVSRGLYFLQEKIGTLKLPTIGQPSETKVDAQSDRAAIRYEFGPDKMKWDVENKTDAPMHFFAVLDRSVTAVRNGKGDWFKTPIVGGPTDAADKSWQSTTWFAGRAKFTLTGGSVVWGPWPNKELGLQVWEATLAPGEMRPITAEIGLTDDAEAAKIAEITGVKPAPPADVILESPLDYQVCQRRTKTQGPMAFRGRIRPAYDRLEVRLTGPALDGSLPDHWQELPVRETAKTFEATLTAPAGGWYRVEVRALKGSQVVGQSAVDHVGVGEVFVGAGQSNSTNCGEERIDQTTGMVSTFSGTDWRLANDPQPGVHDGTGGGSYWPAFGDAMYSKFKVPIGVASTGHSGSSVKEWQPGSEYFRWTTGRMNQFGKEGFRAVLWHQGESDVGMSADEYARRMTALIEESRKATGWDVPWCVAQVSYHTPKEPSFDNPRAGQKKLWTSGVALEGPDTDQLTGDNRDQGGQGIHFSPKGLRAHGAAWAEKIAPWLTKQLKP